MMVQSGLAFKVTNQCWIGSVPPRGSGWVNDRYVKFLLFESEWLTHPLPRGGTDPVQVRLLTFEASRVEAPTARKIGAPTARNMKAWAIGPGERKPLDGRSAEGAE